jgi:hypothetical protein
LGEGSYGYGSSILKQDYLSDIHYDNSIKPIYEILNSNKNNRYKYNRINIGNNFSSNSKTQGYAYGLDTILNTTNYQTTDPQLILPTNFADETIKTKILALLSVDSKPNTNTTNYSFMDIKSDGLIAAPDYGTLSIENDNIIIEPNYCLTTEQIDILVARLSTLNGPAIPLVEVGLAGSAPSNSIINSIDSILTLEQYHDSLPVDPLGICYSKSTYSSKSCPKNETKQRLYRLYDERNEITNLLATRAQETIINGISSYVTLCDNTILPYQSINIVTNEDRSLSFTITSNKDYYWIHIDPHQQCQLSQTATIKILAETKYYCLPTRTITSQGGLQYQVGDPESFNVCLPNPPTKTFTDPDREIESIELGSGSDRGNAAIYKIPPHIIDAQKAKYPQITEWEKVVLYGPTGPTRTFYINTDGGNNDIYVNVTETYWVPAKSYIEQGYQEPLTDVKNKVQDIFNLDNTTELHVRFKNIPRKMKAVDQHYDRYEPNANGGYSQGSLKDGRGGLVNNDLVFWSCFNINNGKHSPLTRFFKGMNEMIFRSFFGSTDGIENKSTEVADSKEPWEWIPYEYDI